LLALGGAAVAVAVIAAITFVAWPRPSSPSDGSIGTLQALDYHSLVFSPTDPNVVFFGHHNGIMRSDDGGRTWRPLVNRANFDAMNLAVSRGDNRVLYLAGHNVFQASLDGGATWQPVPNDLPGLDLHSFTMDPDDPNRLHAWAVGFGVFNSSDGGSSWQQVISNDLPVDVTALASAGGDPEVVYMGTARSGVLRSTDGGQTWPTLDNGVGYRTILSLAVDTAARETVYAGADGGLFKTIDGGITWAQLPLPADNALAVAVGPTGSNVVEAVASKGRQGLVFRSDDGGATWGRR